MPDNIPPEFFPAFLPNGKPNPAYRFLAELWEETPHFDSVIVLDVDAQELRRALATARGTVRLTIHARQAREAVERGDKAVQAMSIDVQEGGVQ